MSTRVSEYRGWTIKTLGTKTVIRKNNEVRMFTNPDKAREFIDRVTDQ